MYPSVGIVSAPVDCGGAWYLTTHQTVRMRMSSSTVVYVSPRGGQFLKLSIFEFCPSPLLLVFEAHPPLAYLCVMLQGLLPF